jgi:hypothetical protein
MEHEVLRVNERPMRRIERREGRGRKKGSSRSPTGGTSSAAHPGRSGREAPRGAFLASVPRRGESAGAGVRRRTTGRGSEQSRRKPRAVRAFTSSQAAAADLDIRISPRASGARLLQDVPRLRAQQPPLRTRMSSSGPTRVLGVCQGGRTILLGLLLLVGATLVQAKSKMPSSRIVLLSCASHQILRVRDSWRTQGHGLATPPTPLPFQTRRTSSLASSSPYSCRIPRLLLGLEDSGNPVIKNRAIACGTFSSKHFRTEN